VAHKVDRKPRDSLDSGWTGFFKIKKYRTK